MSLRSLVAIVFVSTVLLAGPPPDPHAAPGIHPHTSLIPGGIRVDPDRNPFPYVRGVETEKESCTGFDLGCGFVLTAGHCPAENATITMGVKGEHNVGRAVASYTAPGFPVPAQKEGWVSDGGENNDVKLVKFESTAAPGLETKNAAALIDWEAKPFTVDKKRPVEGWIVGYGATNAIWDEKKGTYVPYGPAGELAWGKVPLDYAGWFNHASGLDWAKNFGAPRNGRGRICSEPRDGAHGVINGDSGGPLVGPDGKLRGVISSFARGNKPGEAGKPKFDYVSCYVDLAGHLPWIYETMKADGCRTLPVVASLDKLKSPRGVIERPTRLPDVADLPPPPRVDPNADDKRTVRRLLGLFTYEKMQQKRDEALRGAETLREMSKRYRDRRREYEDEAKQYDELAKAYASAYPAIERGKVNRTQLALSVVHDHDRDDLRAAIGRLVNVPAGQKVSFNGWAKYEGDTVTLTYGFCPSNKPLSDCKFEEKGQVVMTPTEIQTVIRHTVR